MTDKKNSKKGTQSEAVTEARKRNARGRLGKAVSDAKPKTAQGEKDDAKEFLAEFLDQEAGPKLMEQLERRMRDRENDRGDEDGLKK
jgi:hypothetical protein